MGPNAFGRWPRQPLVKSGRRWGCAEVVTMTAGRGRHSPSGIESGSAAHAMAFQTTQRQRRWLDALALAKSITDFINNVPQLQTQLPQIVAPWQERLNALGLSNVNVLDQTEGFINNLNHYAEQLAGPLQQLAVASLNVIGSLLLVLILSLYIVVDRDRIVSFFFRMIPPTFTEDAVLLETSVARSFGGFLRGQALLGLVYGLVAVLTSAILGLAYLPVTSVLAGLLMAIPFFGPFVSW